MKGYKLNFPARDWCEGTLCGNGTMGAIMMGGTCEERIILNREDLFAPLYDRETPIPMAEKLSEIRKLIGEGKYEEAGSVPWKIFLEHHEEKLWTNPYIPAGDLVIRTPGIGEVTGYERSLDFETGIATCAFTAQHIHYQRNVMVSREYQEILVELSADGRAEYQICLEKRPNDEPEEKGAFPVGMFALLKPVVSVKEREIHYSCFYGESSSGYEIILRIMDETGRARVTEIAASEIPSLLIETDGKVVLGISIKKMGESTAAPDYMKKNLLEIREEGYTIHRERYGRIGLKLLDGKEYSDDYDMYSTVRSKEKADAAFLNKIFDAGRYEILSSSGKLPPNLQGVWNGTYVDPWCSDYTQDGNVQTAILGMMPCGDFESIDAYFKYQESLIEDYRENCRILYGCRGIHIPSRTSDCGYDIHFDETWPLLYWTAGAGWAARFYYDYWLYTGDDNFFKERALPFMKEAALFYEDYLFEDERGFWVFSPGYSPENTPEGHVSSVAVNATMDISVARELFTNLICGCRMLKIEGENIRKWEQTLEKMPPYLINKDGALKEWCAEGFEDQYDHRHASHLYLLYYDIPEDIRKDEKLFQACRKAYEIKMERKKKEKGTMAFGLIQAGMVAAHLKDSEMVETMLQSMACNNYYTSFASAHDYGPSIFNADISGGLPALMLEAVAQSFPVLNENREIDYFEVRLLPALPASMSSGKVTGLRLRGGMILDMEWRGGEIITYDLQNPLNKEYRIMIG